MKVIPQPDHWAWAEAVIEEKLRWIFRGVDKPSSRNARGRDDKYTHLGWLLVSSERYMDDWMSEVADGYMESDYDPEWREYCEAKLHREGCCPHSAKEKKAYKLEVEQMFNNRDARRTWAYDRSDASWEWEQINDGTKDLWWVAHFLKEHPVTGVYAGDGDCIDIDDIVAFCEHCDNPITKDHVQVNDDG